ncbi:hypothetical protein TNIN_130191 [Trichonephila inaurata madagascariensis]|uniref:TIL domain-containing protein n=1 Tax=Trichonephila inaurata madagascariensis TaxID=2747483 RepID=A0A8X6XX41_9ARAC|nr:hypothetical protein TNIN_130191 [Trichonephila inaurata madagascariensis]
MAKSLFAFAIFLLALTGIINAQYLCPENQHYSDCGSACEKNCFNPPQVCGAVCVKGCFCDKGYIRLYYSDGPCIPEYYCPF